MPKGTVKDEAKWKRAKRAVEASKKKEEKNFDDQDWGLTQKIYQRIAKAKVPRSVEWGSGSVPAIGNKSGNLFMKKWVVYTLNPQDGIVTIIDYYNNSGKADEHVKRLKKLYAEYIMVGKVPNNGSALLNLALQGGKIANERSMEE